VIPHQPPWMGGNQRNEVSVRRYPQTRVMGFRWPRG
jgi:hypothetical protein